MALMISCSKQNDDSMNIEVSGTIQEQGITTYQYGTHIIEGYALRSSTVNLDDFIGQTVDITGNLIDGYPIDGGPDYLEVEEIN